MSVVKQIPNGCPGCGGDVYLLDSEDEEFGHTCIMCCLNERCGIGTPPCRTPKQAMQRWKEQVAYVEREKSLGNWPH